MPQPVIQIVLYKWKAGLTPARIQFQLDDIRALAGKVSGLISITGGPRKACFNHPANPSLDFDHAFIFTWADDAAFIGWNTHPEHARIGPQILGDVTHLTAYSYVQS